MRATRFAALALTAIALGALAPALRLGLWRAGVPGPGLFPFLSAVLLLLMGLVTAMSRPSAEEAAQAEEAEDGPVDPRRLVGYGAAIAAFGLIMKPLGTAVAVTSLLIAVLRGIERQPWLLSLGLAFGLAILSWGLFEHLLGVPLPRGVLGL